MLAVGALKYTERKLFQFFILRTVFSFSKYFANKKNVLLHFGQNLGQVYRVVIIPSLSLLIILLITKLRRVK